MRRVRWYLQRIAIVAAAVLAAVVLLMQRDLGVARTTPSDSRATTPTGTAAARRAGVPERTETAKRAGTARRSGTTKTAAPAAAGRTCVVARVTDGDTVRCADSTRVRLLLIDAPEMSQKPFGRESRRALEKLVPVGTAARLELDVQPTDRYGRTLAYIRLPDGRLANEEMLREGYAVVLVYPPNVKYVDRFRAAAEGARLARRGLHATSGFECLPRDRRRKAC